MKCPNRPKPSDVNYGTLAVPEGVPARLGHFSNEIHNNNNGIIKLSHCPKHTRSGTVGTLDGP